MADKDEPDLSGIPDIPEFSGFSIVHHRERAEDDLQFFEMPELKLMSEEEQGILFDGLNALVEAVIAEFHRRTNG